MKTSAVPLSLLYQFVFQLDTYWDHSLFRTEMIVSLYLCVLFSLKGGGGWGGGCSHGIRLF